MLNKLRSFSNTKLAGLFIGIIIIPFVFWGMGSVFSGGNTNNVAKINNQNISTKDFIDHINKLRLNPEIIKNNIDNNILERILSELVSHKLLEMEVHDLKVIISENALANKIKSNKIFLDDKNKFSRLKYEKFLLENNFIAPDYEGNLKNEELKKNLFQYIGGGVVSPYFLQNKIYIDETKKIEISYFDLNNSYEKKVTSSEINKFIKENEDILKEDFIDFKYVKITPLNLVETEEFNNQFFKKIDEIENNILNGVNIEEISKINNLKINYKDNYKTTNEADEIFKEIYENRNNKNVQLLDKNNYFLLFEITTIKKVLPSKTNEDFLSKVENDILIKKKLELHKNLFEKIQDKKIDDNEFIKISKSQENIKNTSIKGINDFSKFDEDSVKLIYSLPEKSFVLVTNEKNKIFLAKVEGIFSQKLDKNSNEVEKFTIKSNSAIINDIYSSYDLSLNDKYKVKFFETTMDRVKNYFR